MAEAPQALKKKRERSPAHPGIGLEMALDRARQLATNEQRHPARVEDILSHWGYGAKSGAGLVTLAALKQFGLLTDEGSGANRRARLSDEAWRILFDEREDASERQRLIQEAALHPRIHRELWEQYNGSLPSDATLRSHLKLDRHFTDSAIADFIPQLRSTLAFSGLTNPDRIPADDEREQEVRAAPNLAYGVWPQGVGPFFKRGKRREVRTVPIPVSGSDWPVLQAPFPMTEEAWQQMLAYLDLLKQAFVQAPEEEPEQE